MELLQREYFDNTLLQWALAAAVALAAYVAFQIIKSVVVRRLQKLAATTATDLDDFVVDLLASTKLILIVALSLFAGSYMLSLGEGARTFLNKGAIIVFLLQAALWGNRIINYALGRFAAARMDADDPASATFVSLVGTVGRVGFFALIGMVMLGSLGFDVTALIATAGIGGIAIAMAVQGILADLFSSLSIALDKPFEVGDFITTGDFLGTVEHVGLKSTRLRSVTGEQLVLSNSDLLSSRLRNFGRMSERRGSMTIGVVYETPLAKLRAIPGIIREIIEKNELARFDRAHFASFGDSALNFAVVYWVTSPAYGDFMDTTEAINLEIYRRFEAEGIGFAYPTRTLYVNSEPVAALGAAAQAGS